MLTVTATGVLAPWPSLTVMVPLTVVLDPVNVSVPSSVSVAVSLPVTVPVAELDCPTVTLTFLGRCHIPRIDTLTVLVAVAPYLSVTVIVKVSVLSASVAVSEAAARRAAAVGV
jgi:hypothetical protein